MQKTAIGKGNGGKSTTRIFHSTFSLQWIFFIEFRECSILIQQQILVRMSKFRNFFCYQYFAYSGTKDFKLPESESRAESQRESKNTRVKLREIVSLIHLSHF